MLALTNIKKNYKVGDIQIPALKGVSLQFQKNEFVSILGPSGCGKTTLLNIIGGLDKYSEGDLLVDGKSTRSFSDDNWDAYRNATIGFVFQSYNLISHLNVLDNVAIALSLSGVSLGERTQRAKDALTKVGLDDQFYKRPNQLSGGQMQRVAIARALVNNPKILLADEPTGALDSKTSVQIMELIKEISKDRLVIMVTHNAVLAEKYSDRTIKLLDGLVVEDSRPAVNAIEQNGGALNLKRTSMSFVEAFKSSLKNLMTKKGRTIMTSFAGSIGIIGIALIMSISSGMTAYVNTMQSDTLSGFPITISQTTTASFSSFQDSRDEYLNSINDKSKDFPDGEDIYPYDQAGDTKVHTNNYNSDIGLGYTFIQHLNTMSKSWYNTISYTSGYSLKVLTKTQSGLVQEVKPLSATGISALLGGSSSVFNQLPTDRDFLESQYDMLGNSIYPTASNHVVLIVDKQNRVDSAILSRLGYSETGDYGFEDFLGKKFRVIANNNYYTRTEGANYFTAKTADGTMFDSGYEIEIVGIMRVKESATTELLSAGIGYTYELTNYMRSIEADSEVVAVQKANPGINVLSATGSFTNTTYMRVMQSLGGDNTPTQIQIYPKTFDDKEKIKAHISGYNQSAAQLFEEGSEQQTASQIVYSDLAEALTTTMTTLINTISTILSAIAGISLVVSSIMIGIITFVSVIERTKEIGIMRSIGARKKDIRRIFNAEAMLIGLVAGIVGVTLSLLLTIPINAVIGTLTGAGMSAFTAYLPVFNAVALVAVSVLLTFIAGLLPSNAAAKKDPVIALRTE